MTKTKSSMKWLVLALLVVVIAGAIALSLSLNAKATGEKAKIYVFIANSSYKDTYAATVARSVGVLGAEETIPNGLSSTGDIVFFTTNTASLSLYSFPSRNDASFATYYARADCISRFLEENSYTPDMIDPEIQVYVCQGTLTHTSNATANMMGGSANELFPNNANVYMPTYHIYGCGSDQVVGHTSNITVPTSGTYLKLYNNVILENITFRCDKNTSNSGKSSAVCTAVVVYGCTLHVKQGSTILEGTSTSSYGTKLTRIMNGNFSNAYITNGNSNNNTIGDPTTIGRIILEGGTYTYVNTVGGGTWGVKKTTPGTAPTAEGFDEATHTANWYNYTTADDLALSVDGDDETNPSGWGTASNWRTYDYKASAGGKVDAYVTVGGNATVSYLGAGPGNTTTVTGDILTGEGVTAHITVNEGATITGALYANWGYALKEIASSKTRNSLIQGGSIDVTINGGNIAKFQGGLFYSVAGASGNTYGQAHAFGDLTVNVKGGTFNGNNIHYLCLNVNSQTSNAATEAAVIHGDIHYTFGDPEHPGVGGPTISEGSATLRTAQGSQTLKDGSFVADFYGGSYNVPFWAVAAGSLYYSTEINLYGGHFVHVGGGFAAGPMETGCTVITEDLTGRNLSKPVRTVITVDGAQIDEMYGGRSGGTNTGSYHQFSIRNILKSGTVGSYYLFNSVEQTKRVGASDNNSANELIYWATLGDPSYAATGEGAKPLVIGEYYAASAYLGSDNGNGNLYAGNAAVITQAYQNVILSASTAETNLGKAAGTYSGEFYALGKESNTEAGKNSGSYYVDVVLDTHGFDIDSRTNTNLFANVKMEGALSNVMVPTSMTINIAGLDAEHKLVITKGLLGKNASDKYYDTDDGILFNNLIANTNANCPGEVTINGKTSALNKTVPVYVGDIRISLTDVQIGENGTDNMVNLIQTMQCKGDITNTLTRCKVNGIFVAQSNVAAGVPTVYSTAGVADLKVNVTNTLTDCEITGNYVGGAVNSFTVADTTNTLTRCDIGGDCVCGVWKLSNVYDLSEGLATAGVYSIGGGSGSGARSNGVYVNTITDCTVTGNFRGGNANSAMAESGVTNNINGNTVVGTFWGSGNASTTNGDVTNNINGLTFNTNYFGGTSSGTHNGNVVNNFAGVKANAVTYGGGDSGATAGTVTTNVTGFWSVSNETEAAFYAGSASGSITKTGQDAVILTVDPGANGVWFNGIVVAGSNTGAITGNLNVTLKGGVQHSGRHLILGSRQTTGTEKRINGNVTCNIYAGNWGTIYLGGRNNTTAVTDASVTGSVTCNVWGGSIATVKQGYSNYTVDESGETPVVTPGRGCYAGGTVALNLHLDDPATPVATDDLVLRGTINPETGTYSTDPDHVCAPYTVNVISGGNTLYFANGGSTYADGTTSARSASATLVADNVDGTVKIAPADNNYYYAIPAGAGYGETGYKTDAEEATKGILGYGATGSYDWSEGARFTIKGTADTTLVDISDADTAYGTLTAEAVEELADPEDPTSGTGIYDVVISATDNRLNNHFGTQVVMDAKFTVRVLFEKAKVDLASTLTVTCAVNDGAAETMTLLPGTGDYADYYYFDVDGISAAEYQDTTFTLVITEDDLAPRTVTFKGRDILDGLNEMGGDNATLAAAISDFTAALSTYFEDPTAEIPAATVADVNDEQAAEILVDNGKTANTSATVMDDHIKAVGLTLTVSDKVTINYWFHVTQGAEITSAAIGTHTLANGELTLIQRYNGEEATNYWTVSYDCAGNDLYTMLTLTVNGTSAEFSACPLTYAQALKATNPDLAQAIINYAYYISQFAVAA